MRAYKEGLNNIQQKNTSSLEINATEGQEEQKKTKDVHMEELKELKEDTMSPE